jgi:hypothetical protein
VRSSADAGQHDGLNRGTRAAGPRVVIHLESGEDVLIVRGTASLVS